MKKFKAIAKVYQATLLVSTGVKLYKYNKTKALVKDDELTDLLAKVIIERVTPIIAKDYGIDLTKVTYTQGDIYPYVFQAPANAHGVTFTNCLIEQCHVHYFPSRIKARPLTSIQDFAYCVLEIVAHELWHVKQHQTGLDLATLELIKLEAPAYTKAAIKAITYRHEVKAILNELGL